MNAQPWTDQQLSDFKRAYAMNSDYSTPQRIRLSAAALAEFIECEMGSFEDHQAPDADHSSDYCKEHVVEILRRHNAMIEVRNDAEAATVYLAACSGTFQLGVADRGDDPCYYHVARRICDRTRDAMRRIDSKGLAMWPAPTGQ